MAIDERRRHEMYLKLEEVLGAEPASTLMSHLPPVGWADVATKQDLEILRLEFDAKLESKLNAQTKSLFVGLSGIMLTGVTLAFAAGRLA